MLDRAAPRNPSPTAGGLRPGDRRPVSGSIAAWGEEESPVGERTRGASGALGGEGPAKGTGTRDFFSEDSQLVRSERVKEAGESEAR
jgi:hypothetical protein